MRRPLVSHLNCCELFISNWKTPQPSTLVFLIIGEDVGDIFLFTYQYSLKYSSTSIQPRLTSSNSNWNNRQISDFTLTIINGTCLIYPPTYVSYWKKPRYILLFKHKNTTVDQAIDILLLLNLSYTQIHFSSHKKNSIVSYPTRKLSLFQGRKISNLEPSMTVPRDCRLQNYILPPSVFHMPFTHPILNLRNAEHIPRSPESLLNLIIPPPFFLIHLFIAAAPVSPHRFTPAPRPAPFPIGSGLRDGD